MDKYFQNEAEISFIIQGQGNNYRRKQESAVAFKQHLASYSM